MSPRKALKFALAMTLGLSATAASAATFTYDLFDHPDRAQSPSEYGLRLDYVTGGADTFFSFEDGSGNSLATLVYDDAAGTATITGQMRLNFGGVDDANNLWDIQYDLGQLTNTGSGTFEDTFGAGSGSIISSFDATEYVLGTQANSSNVYFEFDDDGHRLGGFPEFDENTFVGRGWVNPQGYGNSTNDFLFIAQESVGGTGGEIPLPAAGWMLLTGLAGLGAYGRRRRR